MSLLSGPLGAAETSTERRNLAAGQPVRFSGPPDRYAPPGADLSGVLTDGQWVQDARDYSQENRIKLVWREGNGENQRINWWVDLGRRGEVDELAIRFSKASVPVWAEAFVSEDGRRWVRVAERSRWQTPEFYRGPQAFFRDPQAAQEAGYWWRWEGLRGVRGRYLGVRLWPGMTIAADEWQVWGRPAPPGAASTTGPSADFAIDVPQVFFPKPELVIPTNLTAPQSLASTTPGQIPVKGLLEVELDLPAGLVLDAPRQPIPPEQADRTVGAPLAVAAETALADGRTRYRLRIADPVPARVLARLYLRAPGARDGQRGELIWRYRFGDWQSPELTTAYRTVTVPETPVPQRLLTVGFGLWTIEGTLAWPDALATFRHLGINTLSLFGESRLPEWMPPARAEAPAWRLLDEARRQGFKIFASDATFMPPWRKYPNTEPVHRELYCQLPNGEVGDLICPSYRGKYYQEEVARYLRQMAEVRPDIIFMDMESWNTRQRFYEACSRCQDSYRHSGLSDWNTWVQSQGRAMVQDAVEAARAQARSAGATEFVALGYAINPVRHGVDVADGVAGVFGFETLYPHLFQMANESVYSPYYPGYFENVRQSYPGALLGLAQRFRNIRQRMPRSDLLAMLTPGDTGGVPAAEFQWAILEAFCNGARGMSFWGRSWDAESVVAYSRAIRALAPVEAILVEGELLQGEVGVAGPGHVSGVRRGRDFVVLVSDYPGDSDGVLQLQLDLPSRSRVRDLLTGEIVAENLASGRQRLALPLQGELARCLVIFGQ